MKRRKTREIPFGKVFVGGENPIRIQSMTTSDTRDVQATVDQVLRLQAAGCEIVRFTVQGKKEARACFEIKEKLLSLNCDLPLVADIHFYPPAALLVAQCVDNIRINPGNFADPRAQLLAKDFSDSQYEQGLKRIEDRFIPLIEVCKKEGRSLRIGCNHGSLSDRIMSRYGDSPEGMLESAFEYLMICRQQGFHDLIFSMKSSNTQVMITAYRLLVSRLDALGWDYPIHLGVTEAGEGEDGRIKSAVGIGTLLLDGIGDTIRVSLTEDPWHEIDPCQRLAKLAPEEGEEKRSFDLPPEPRRYKPFQGLHRNCSFMLRISPEDLDSPSCLKELGYEGEKGEHSIDVLYLDEEGDFSRHREILKTLRQKGAIILALDSKDAVCSLLTIHDEPIFTPYFLRIDANNDHWEKIQKHSPQAIIFEIKDLFLSRTRSLIRFLKERKLTFPCFLSFSADLSSEDFLIQASAYLGSLLCDRAIEGFFLEGQFPLSERVSLSLGIAQAARLRHSKTEFISCPSCGRTLFNLQEVSRKIRLRTDHLAGVKIAIMGCIVNGPGEMADADFGYVGSGRSAIDLYVGKEKVEVAIPEDQAVDRLISLIKRHGMWKEAEPK